MGVALIVGNKQYEIGSSSFLKSFFSTIYFHLGKGHVGSPYPKIFNDFYNGHLKWEDANEAMSDLNDIKEKLKLLNPDKVVWDIHDLAKKPPWGDNISPNITSLSNYFKTSKGEDLFDVIFKALDYSIKNEEDIKIS